jgi:hypothetical protein
VAQEELGFRRSLRHSLLSHPIRSQLSLKSAKSIMKFVATLVTIFGASLTSAFAPSRVAFSRPTGLSMAEQFDQEKFIAESKEMRLKHLEEQAMYALKISCENYANAVFPNAMIAGDVVSRFSRCVCFATGS